MQVTPFIFQDSAVRIVTIGGDPWFVLNDVCDILDIANPRMVAERIDPDYVSKTDVADSRGQIRRTNVVSEFGLYEVIVRSNAPAAKPFQKWVFEEVLPQIRKTGSYGQALTLEQRSLALISDLNNEVQRQAAQIEAQAPLVAQAETYSEGRGKQKRQQFARDIAAWAQRERGVRIRHSDVMEFLGRKLGLFIIGKRSDAGEATTEAIRRGLADTNRGTAPNGHNFSTGYLTPEGVQYAWDRCVRYIDQHGTLELSAASPHPKLEVV